MKKITLVMLLLGILFYACGSNETETNADDTQQVTASEPDGEALYQSSNCATCHGAFGDPVLPEAKDLRNPELTLAQRIETITNGSKANPTMIAFKNSLSEAEIKAVAEFTMTLIEE